ncbi:MAG: hypothetical protein KDK30_09935 [Leptospiraceae bacterium]|nr:hypothetical protein [Leptospiraceae bacterium]
MRRIQIALLFFLILAVTTALEARQRVAIVPFSRGEDVNDYEYYQIYHSFYLALSYEEDFDMVTTFEVSNMFQKMEGEFEESTDIKEQMYTTAREYNIDLLVFGRVDKAPRSTGRLDNIVGLSVNLVNVEHRKEFNEVTWSADYTYRIDNNGMNRLELLSRVVAAKLLWQNPELYPVNVYDGNILQAQKSNEYESQVRDRLKGLLLPRGVEIDAVRATVNEQRSAASTRFLGCVTLVGWLFLPYTTVDYDVNLAVRVKYLSDEGVQYVDFSVAEKDRQEFGVSASAIEINRPMEALLNKSVQSVIRNIQGDTRLGAAPGNLLERYLQ